MALNQNQIVTLNILLTSDVHGTVYPIHYQDNSKAEIGLAKISTLIKKERSQNANVLLIDNGDFIQGTPFTYHYATYEKDMENPMSLLANYLEYDIAIIGNHEFNYGMDILNNAVTTANSPYLSANILDKNRKEPYFGKPYIIKHIESNIKIAILGVTTHYIPHWEQAHHIKDLQFEDAFETTKKWVSYIRKHEKPDLLVVAYHGGFERDLQTGVPTEVLTGENQGYAMCHEIEGIDILLTGHQHREIAHTVINGVTILQTGCNGHSVGKVTVTFEKAEQKWVKKRVIQSYCPYKELRQTKMFFPWLPIMKRKHKIGLINLLE